MPIFSHLDLKPHLHDLTRISLFQRRCKPKVLVVTDGGLNYLSNDGFGLSRFIEAIGHHSSATLKPAITLAHRGAHSANVTIGGTNYSVDTGFDFSSASPAVTLSNYDQIWLFGISSSGSISDSEIQVIADFMNSGGGVFATGDHASLGATINAKLPRIRHMRNWNAASNGGVPMGTEALPLARERIDTISSPGVDSQYQFHDQSDDIPQRIYPNYTVTGTGGNDWTASIHPVLRLPGASVSRSPMNGNFANSTGLGAGSLLFSHDIDVLPDHPHESECFEISANVNLSALNGTYNEAGMSFAEFPDKASGGGKVGAEILAFAVSGGRTVYNFGIWKPPVRPRMFGAMSGFDGHQANPLPGNAARPGRIMCDATWHHFVNINLDGTDSDREGMGSWTGTAFTPSANLLKIYKYYQNMISWLQPSNRIWCRWLIILEHTLIRAELREELLDTSHLKTVEDITIFGRNLSGMIDHLNGTGTALDIVRDALRESNDDEDFGRMLDPSAAELDPSDIANVVGFVMGTVAKEILPNLQINGDENFVESKKADNLHDRFENQLQESTTKLVRASIRQQAKFANERAEKKRAVLERLAR